MKTFTLTQRDAEAMISVLNAVQPQATFVQELTQQFMAQAQEVIEEVLAESVKEVNEVVEEVALVEVVAEEAK